MSKNGSKVKTREEQNSTEETKLIRFGESLAAILGCVHTDRDDVISLIEDESEKPDPTGLALVATANGIEFRTNEGQQTWFEERIRTYVDYLEQKNNQRSANAPVVDPSVAQDGDTNEILATRKEIGVVSERMKLKASTFLTRLRDIQVENYFAELFPDVVLYMQLRIALVKDAVVFGKVAGTQTTLISMSDIRRHIFELTGYKVKAEKKDGEKKAAMGAVLEHAVEHKSGAYESVVTRACKAGFLHVNSILVLTAAPNKKGQMALFTQDNKLNPLVDDGQGGTAPNTNTHMVPVGGSIIDKMYTRLTRSEKGASTTMLEKVPASDVFKRAMELVESPDLKADDRAALENMVSKIPASMWGPMIRSNLAVHLNGMNNMLDALMERPDSVTDEQLLALNAVVNRMDKLNEKVAQASQETVEVEKAA